jgi:CDP-glucose 4,6-dehydratase
MQWHQTHSPKPHEANLLFLDITKARSQLGWSPVWDLDATLGKTADWYRIFLESNTTISAKQLSQYVEAAKNAQAGWVSA